jgi:hypothetical protein
MTVYAAPKSHAAQGPQLSVGIGGTAYDIYVRKDDTARAVQVRTALPVLYYAGLSRTGKFRAYTTLAAYNQFAPGGRDEISAAEVSKRHDAVLVPSGDLYVENVSTGAYWQIDGPEQYVVAAAWSPTNPEMIAYTFSSGAAYGIAVIHAVTKEGKVLRERDVVPDYLAWSPSGLSVQFYREETVQALFSDEEIAGSLHQDSAAVEVANAAAEPWSLQLPMLEIKSASNSVPAPFRIALPGGTSARGDNLFGRSTLRLSDPSGKVLGQADADAIVGVVPSGILFKTFGADHTELGFIARRGTVAHLVVKVAVSYWLPFFAFTSPTLTVTQTGNGYSPNCQVWDHTIAQGMGYAYDMQAKPGSEYIEASASGTVAYLAKTFTCNSLDDGSVDGTRCPDYTNPCSSNSGFGNVIILQHADGTWTKYAHLKPSSVLPTANGQSVGRGCHIATQGHTGATRGNLPNGCGDHLHFQRQSSGALTGSSISISFADTSNPLTCTTYTSGNTGQSCLFN